MLGYEVILYKLWVFTLGLKALGLRSKHCLIDFCRCFSCARLLKQLLQLQLLQNSPLAKQSQYLKWKWQIMKLFFLLGNGNIAIRHINVICKITYNFKHCDFVQLQGFFGLTPDASNETCADELESRRSPWLILELLRESNLSRPWFCLICFSSFISTWLK